MRAVVQRVSEAAVRIDGQIVGEIGAGLLALVGVTHSDGAAEAAALARKIHQLRILRDERSVADSPGTGILVVSQFTLYGDARKGRRPTWLAAAPGAIAEPLIDVVVATLRAAGADVATGKFGADMSVHLVNDGPITLVIDI
jgi:D-tyrosyl-tRNA(Tyr) deacylase